ncbi:MAG: hypothetical protein B7W97_00915 [Mycobacterium sp. 20-66-4]|nr:MAG: hypothetical protein B7W97_00915 [Mycobacterium sp. 20-66-4]
MDAGVERVVYTSSVATLGLNPDRAPADEETPVALEQMIGHYKRSKFLAERAVLEMVHRQGLPAVVVNPSTPVGPRDIKPTPTGRMIRDAARGKMPAYVDTGLNIAHYPDAVTELVLAEPESGMRRRLERRLHLCARAARVVDAPAELLPLADASVDAVVSTLVLCTVDDPEGALREIARVLRPNGQLLFIEHVLSNSPLLAACQRFLSRPWRHFAGGCRCSRATVELMRACGFAVTADDVVWRGMPAIVHPLAVGRACPRA